MPHRSTLTVAVIGVSLDQPVPQRRLGDPETLRDLSDRMVFLSVNPAARSWNSGECGAGKGFLRRR
jgi:hypothetical protein